MTSAVELRALDPRAASPRLQPAWAAPAAGGAGGPEQWHDPPGAAALAACREGRIVAVAAARATACGARFDAVHGDLGALLEAAAGAFPGRRLEVRVDDPRPPEGVAGALTRAGYAAVLDQVRYEGPLRRGRVAPDALESRPYADVGRRATREILERVFDTSVSPTGRTAGEELAELLLGGEGETRLWRIAYAGGDPVGLALAALDEPGTGTLRFLGVVGERRRRGLGSRLHQAALGLLYAHGARRYVDATAAGNETVRRHLEGLGARRAGAWRLYARAPAAPREPLAGPDALRAYLAALGLAVDGAGDRAHVEVRDLNGRTRVALRWEPGPATVAVGGERLLLDRDGALDAAELRLALWRAARAARPEPTLLRAVPLRPPPSAAAVPFITLGPFARLSQSPLWALQRRYFRASGIDAWSTGAVPHHVTSNPVIARAYARVVAAFLADCEATGGLDRRAPVHVLELGCGSGRFAHRFLAQASDPRLRYWATDLAEENLDFLERHPALQPAIQRRRLALGAFDAVAPAPVAARGTGDALLAAAPANPLVVIANYVFDGLPQDAVTVAGGRLAHWELRLSAPAEIVEAGREHVELGRLRTEWRLVRGDAPAPPLAEGTTYLDPTGAVAVLSWLAERAPRGLLVLSADRGAVTAGQLEQSRGAPPLSRHGSVSLDVDYRALGAWASGRGAIVLAAHATPHALAMQAQVHGDAGGALAATRAAFAEHLDAGGPDDFFALKAPAIGALRGEPLATQLAYLRLAGWDSKTFLDMREGLHGSVPAASALAIADALAAADAVESNHLALPGDALPQALGEWRTVLRRAGARR